MSSLNRVILVGRLGANPVVRETKSGKRMTQFPLATSIAGKGDEPKRTSWHSILVWGRQAEVCAEFLTKGRNVCVEGSLQPSVYQSKEGVTQKKVEILADRVHFLDSKKRTAEVPGAEEPAIAQA